MSQVEAFFRRVEQDTQLQAVLHQVAADPDSVVDIASSVGFQITSGELMAARSMTVTDVQAPPRGEPSSAINIVCKPDCCFYARACMPGFIGG